MTTANDPGTAPGAPDTGGTDAGARRPRVRLAVFLGLGLLVALLLAGVASNFASSHPDGLDATAREGCTFNADDEITGGDCMAKQAREHDLADSPLADYGVRGLSNPFLSTGASGVVGVLIVLAVSGGTFWLLRRRGTSPADGPTGPLESSGPAGSVAPAPKPPTSGTVAAG